ncbi:MAG TPA: molybdopterin-dependent oxidoreductase [Spirochaetota bacterium]|nr:molybdopterin-dependent oxidoreductase [Spirochaetota bacterium]HPJ36983.1 molybdopterin-dependent oxidoreductase [Spirochaetota bacterium]HPQ51751.1 molybdopterin-dependent oxidoreductase [Spirochaetota bacterium]
MKKIERRDFLKMAGGAVCGGLVGTTFSGAPFLGFQWLVEWSQDQYVPTRGEEKFANSVCHLCGSNITVRKIGQRAVKVETANSGCPLCQAMLQLLYHPERIQQPLKRVGSKGSGKFKPVTWEEAVKDVSDAITKLRSENKAQMIAAVNGAHNTVPNLLMERLVMAAGSKHVYTEPCFCNLSKSAVAATQNAEGTIDYDLENADYVISFGARLFEGWGNSARMNKVLLEWKKKNVKFVQVDTLCTRTASMADSWVPVKPGTESYLALGIAHQLIMNHGKSSNLSELSRWSGINEFSPDKVSAITGVPAEKIAEIAKEFVKYRKAVAVAGRGGQCVSSSVAEIAAVQALNALIAHLGKDGNAFIKACPSIPAGVQYDDIAKAGHNNTRVAKGLDDFIKNGEKVELLFLNESNPVFNSVYGADFVNKMKDMPMVVAFGTLINDSAKYADYIFPTLTIMEVPTAQGNAVAAPRYTSKHGGDIILDIARKTEKVKDAFPWTGVRDVAAIVRDGQTRGVGNFSISTDLLKKHFTELKKAMEESAQEYPLVMIPFEIPFVGDGRSLAFPYVLKGLGHETYSAERLYVQMNPETAREQGVSDGSNIYISSKRGEIGKVKVLLTKTVAPGVIAMPMGFGHAALTKYGSEKGVNPREIMNNAIDAESGTADWWYTRVKLS